MLEDGNPTGHSTLIRQTRTWHVDGLVEKNDVILKCGRNIYYTWKMASQYSLLSLSINRFSISTLSVLFSVNLNFRSKMNATWNSLYHEESLKPIITAGSALSCTYVALIKLFSPNIKHSPSHLDGATSYDCWVRKSVFESWKQPQYYTWLVCHWNICFCLTRTVMLMKTRDSLRWNQQFISFS